MRELAERQPPASDEEQRKYFLNYMTRAAKSALFDFIEEGLPHRMMYADEVRTNENESADSSDARSFVESLPDSSPPAFWLLAVPEEEADVRARLAAVPLELRVPFLLTYLVDMLSREELEWLAALRNTSVEDVEQLINEERAAHFGRRYPLSSAFIGALLGVSPDLVSQRVRRARALLAKSYQQSLS